MVEVFKTNVDEFEEAKLLTEKLAIHFSNHKINFDIADCDKILRVEGDNISPEKIIKLMNLHNYHCEILE